MKTTLLEVGKKAIFLQFFENSLNSIDVSLAWVFGLDEDVIEINNDKNIKFLGQDLVNKALEAGQCVEQPKKHYLVLEMAVSSPVSHLLFIAFFHPHLMINKYEVNLGEVFYSTSSI